LARNWFSRSRLSRLFASKAGLGAAVADRYTRRFATALAALDGDQSKSSMAMWRAK
jgi:hypothetical protein